MEYKKPEVLAINTPKGSYSAGCPEKGPTRGGSFCTSCEIKA